MPNLTAALNLLVAIFCSAACLKMQRLGMNGLLAFVALSMALLCLSAGLIALEQQASHDAEASSLWDFSPAWQRWQQLRPRLSPSPLLQSLRLLVSERSAL